MTQSLKRDGTQKGLKISSTESRLDGGRHFGFPRLEKRTRQIRRIERNTCISKSSNGGTIKSSGSTPIRYFC